ncbi:MAG: PDZ domain-containing protein [Candidatus Eremiobacteraeota bacterium]|nr:PDZ domain-containing protein [Candidatus Eremiobacteraeota bacterium]
MRGGVRPSLVAALLFAMLIALVPTPYWILAPGNAVDLSEAVTVEGHAPPVDRFYLTDVTVQHPSTLQLLRGLLTGARVVRRDAIVPRGISTSLYDRRLLGAMEESEATAAVVAERAAGFRVADAPAHVVVSEILPGSHAAGILYPDDEVIRIDGMSVSSLPAIRHALAAAPPGADLSLLIRRNERLLAVRVPTLSRATGPRIGIALERRQDSPTLPVPVRYALGDVGGSSGGLMLALQIYNALRGDRRHHGTTIAGTGTIALDGTVGPIEGTLQKLIAAKRAGARIFLVPRQNFADVAGERGVRVIPVASFRDALRALAS